jgi:sigma-B regulation protein RsbU (phosphoserine phosphatase)
MKAAAESSDGMASQDALAQLRHDLSTPINQILGYSELLEEEVGAEQAELVTDLRKIRLAANTMLSMVRGRLSVDLLASAVGARPSKAVGEPVLAADLAADLAVEDDDSEGLQQPRAVVKASKPGRILAVDDDALNLDVLAKRLTRQGHLVSTAADGEAALKKLRQEPFDLVLLDVMMPRLDGYGTLAALKADEELSPIPVIMISALDELTSVVRCIEAGAEDYLPKPFNPTLLRARVGACLDKKWAHDQQLALYQQLLVSQRQLDRELVESSRRMQALSPELRQDPRVAPLLEAFVRMSGAVSRRETDLRSTISELKIEINRTHLGRQVTTIVADPSFSSLSQRAKAMRERRQRLASNP